MSLGDLQGINEKYQKSLGIYRSPIMRFSSSQKTKIFIQIFWLTFQFPLFLRLPERKVLVLNGQYTLRAIKKVVHKILEVIFQSVFLKLFQPKFQK